MIAVLRKAVQKELSESLKGLYARIPHFLISSTEIDDPLLNTGKLSTFISNMKFEGVEADRAARGISKN